MTFPRRAHLAASMAMAFAVACRHTPQHLAHDSARLPAPASPTLRVPLVVSSGPPQFPIAAFARDGRNDFAPAVPAHCTQVGTARHLLLPENAPAVFATAASAGRTLVALGAGLEGDAGATAITDSATWVFEANDEAPRWFRGPIEPRSTSAVASGTSGMLRIAWTRGAEDPADDGVLRVATFLPGPGDPAIDTLGTFADPVVSDLTCEGAACVLASGWHDRLATEAPERAAFDRIDGHPSRRLAPPGSRPLNAIVPASDDLIGTVATADGPALVPEQPGGPPVAIHRSVLDVARIHGVLYAVTARAPGDARCQPHAWTVELARLDAGGALREPVTIATADARPRGMRLRALGDSGQPLVTWLDAPQCAERFFVVRTWYRGEGTPIGTAIEYDIATDGSLLSLVWRERDRLRWVRARCEDPAGTHDP